jgi:hypothetical protein
MIVISGVNKVLLPKDERSLIVFTGYGGVFLIFALSVKKSLCDYYRQSG